jgi:hypothetical protein
MIPSRHEYLNSNSSNDKKERKKEIFVYPQVIQLYSWAGGAGVAQWWIASLAGTIPSII